MVQHLSRIALFVQLTHQLLLVVNAKCNAPQLLALHHPSSVFSLFPNPQLHYICQRNSTTSSYAFTQPPQTFPPSIQLFRILRSRMPDSCMSSPSKKHKLLLQRKKILSGARRRRGLGKEKQSTGESRGRKPRSRIL